MGKVLEAGIQVCSSIPLPFIAIFLESVPSEDLDFYMKPNIHIDEKGAPEIKKSPLFDRAGPKWSNNDVFIELLKVFPLIFS